MILSTIHAPDAVGVAWAMVSIVESNECTDNAASAYDQRILECAGE